jgi:hypothetical protein
MSDNKKQTDNKHKCNQCSYKTDNSHDLYKHECQHHPKNKTEEVWADHANEGFRNHNGSSYYESYGPWY